MQKNLFAIIDGKVTADRKCVACPLGLDPRLQSNCMPGSGEKEPLLMFIGSSPSWEDDAIGVPFTGSVGNIFRELLVDAGIKYSEIYITNAVRCASDNPKATNFVKCREHLIREIEAIRPKALVAIGGQAHSQLIGRSANKIRQKEFSCALIPGLKVYAISQPTTLFQHEDGEAKERAYNEFVEDLAWIKQQALIGGKSMRPQDYRMAKTLSEVDAFLEELAQPHALAFDFETNNFLGRPHKELGHHLVAAGFSKGHGHARIIPARMKAIKTPLWWDEDTEKKVHERLRNFLSKQLLYGHNAYSYDTLVARGCLDVHRVNIDFDTMLGQYCLDEEPPHDLEHVALRYTSFDKLWKEKFNLDDPYKLAEYLYMDVDATSQIREAIEPQLVDGLRELLDDILLPTGRVMTDMQWRGVYVDKDNLLLLKQQLREKQAETLEKIKHLDAVARWEISANRHFNPASPQQVGEIMEKVLQLPKIKETDSGGYSTDDSVMERYKDKEFCKLLLDHRKLGKLEGTYVSGLEEVLSPKSFAHTSYTIITKTGRAASREPNLQNLPREATAREYPIKKAFKPRSPSRCFIELDYSQAELRVWASLSGDEKLIHAYQNNIDVHRATAADAYGKKPEEVTDEERNAAKCFHPDTEVLTRTGWKKIIDLNFSDYVLQAHPGDNFQVDFSWTHPTGIQRLKHPSGTICHLKNEGIDLRVTNDHRMLGWTSGFKKPKDYLPKAFANRAPYGWVGAGMLRESYWEGPLPSEELLRLVVAAQADGSISSYGGLSFNFSKERKVERLKALLAAANVPYSFSVKGNGTFYFGIRVADAPRITDLLSKKVFDWRLLALPLNLRQAIVEESEFWDATRIKRSIQYFSTVQQNIDVLQALAVSVGRKARSAITAIGTGNRADSRLLSIKDRPHCGSARIGFTETPYDGEVVCLSVPSSYVLVRDGGVPVVTGQCVNFGVIYGKQEETLVRDFVDIAEATARKNGRKISRAERQDAETRARTFFRKHQETFVAGWAWLREQMKIVVTSGVQILPSHRRRRHRKSDHSAQREGVNFPIQSLANEVCFAALRELDRLLPTIEGADAYLVLTVHDSIVIECEERFLWQVAQMGYDVMTGIKFDWMKVPMDVDAKTGSSYGDLRKVDLKNRTVQPAKK